MQVPWQEGAASWPRSRALQVRGGGGVECIWACMQHQLSSLLSCPVNQLPLTPLPCYDTHRCWAKRGWPAAPCIQPHRWVGAKGSNRSGLQLSTNSILVFLLVCTHLQCCPCPAMIYAEALTRGGSQLGQGLSCGGEWRGRGQMHVGLHATPAQFWSFCLFAPTSCAPLLLL